jgi:hypothetical protein
MAVLCFLLLLFTAALVARAQSCTLGSGSYVAQAEFPARAPFVVAASGLLPSAICPLGEAIVDIALQMQLTLEKDLPAGSWVRCTIRHDTLTLDT